MGTISDAERRRLIEANLPLVRHVVFQVAVHFPRHVDREELATAGSLGLVEAARRFDPDRGVPFDRFAARRIRGAILDAVRAADWAPRSVRNNARRLEAIEQRLASELGRSPTNDEIAQALGITSDDLHRLRDRLFRSVVLALEYEVNEADEELTLVEVLRDDASVEPSDELEHRELLAYMRDAVELLPDRHRTVIRGYFLHGHKSQALADELGVTESRISQLRSEALIMLREGIQAQYSMNQFDHAEPVGRVAKRKARYAGAIAERSAWAERLSS
jgi:RNA polymerase sigma factor for flagellar operon FliA